MLKIFSFLLILIFSGSIFCQNTVPKKTFTKREIMIKKINIEIDKSIVFEQLRKINLEMQKASKDGQTLRSSKYSTYCIYIKCFIDYKWFIADTGLSKKWLKSIYDLLKYMGTTRDIIETATINGYTESAKYKQAVKYFDVAYKRFVKLIKKPVRVSSKSVRKTKLKKALWQKAMRKKYKIKVKIQAVEF